MERCQVIAPVHVSRNPTVLVSPTVLYAPRFTVTPPSAPLLYKPKPTVRLADSPRRQTRKRPVLRSAVISEQHSDEDCRGSHAAPRILRVCRDCRPEDVYLNQNSAASLVANPTAYVM